MDKDEGKKFDKFDQITALDAPTHTHYIYLYVELYYSIMR